MADNVIITLTTALGHDKRQRTRMFAGRLIGAMNAAELLAVINTKDAGRKLFSQQSLSLAEFLKIYNVQERIVLATTAYSASNKRVIYISPPIKYVGYTGGKKKYFCEDDTEIELEEN